MLRSCLPEFALQWEAGLVPSRCGAGVPLGLGDHWPPRQGSRFGRTIGRVAGWEADRVHPAVTPMVAVAHEASSVRKLCTGGLKSPAL